MPKFSKDDKVKFKEEHKHIHGFEMYINGYMPLPSFNDKDPNPTIEVYCRWYTGDNDEMPHIRVFDEEFLEKIEEKLI
jgi:hypothetical protein